MKLMLVSLLCLVCLHPVAGVKIECSQQPDKDGMFSCTNERGKHFLSSARPGEPCPTHLYEMDSYYCEDHREDLCCASWCNKDLSAFGKCCNPKQADHGLKTECKAYQLQLCSQVEKNQCTDTWSEKNHPLKYLCCPDCSKLRDGAIWVQGLVADPVNCENYYFCMDGEILGNGNLNSVSKPCGEGKAWNPRIGRSGYCDKAENTDCEQGTGCRLSTFDGTTMCCPGDDWMKPCCKDAMWLDDSHIQQAKAECLGQNVTIVEP